MNYYFATDGLPGNTGTSPSSPWPVSKIETESFASGDKILLKAGSDPYGTINISNLSGVTFGKYGSGADPTFSSLITVTGWTDIGSGKWTYQNSNLGSSLLLVLIDNIIKGKGRYPESGYLDIIAASPTQVQLDGIVGSFVGGQIGIRKESFITDIHPITAQTDDVLDFTNSNSNYNPKVGYGAFIQNHPDCLTQEGDWCYDASTKTLTMYFGAENPNDYSVKIPLPGNGLTLTNLQNCTFANWGVNGVDGYGIELDTCQNITFTDIKVFNTGLHPIQAPDETCSNIFIHTSTAEKCIQGGIYFGYKNHNIQTIDCTVKNVGMIEGGADEFGNSDSKGNGITLQWGTGNKAHNCEVDTVGNDGISVNGSGASITDNLIQYYAQKKADAGGIYNSIGNEPYVVTDQILIKGNRVLHGAGPIEGTIEVEPVVHGVYMDDNMHNVLIEENLASKSLGSGLYLHNTQNITHRNNDWVDNKRQVNISKDNGFTFEDITFEGDTLVCLSPDQSFIFVNGTNYVGDWSAGNNYHYAGDQPRFEFFDGVTLPYCFGIGIAAWRALSGETGEIQNTWPYAVEVISSTALADLTLAAGRAASYLPIGQVTAGETLRLIGSVAGDFPRMSWMLELDWDNPYAYPRAKKTDSSAISVVMPVTESRLNETLQFMTETAFTGASLTDLTLERVNVSLEDLSDLLTLTADGYILDLPLTEAESAPIQIPSDMKSTLNYVNYFESLVARAKFLDLFYYGYDEFKEHADDAEGTVMVLEPYDNPISENQNDNALATRSGMFVIIKPYSSDLGREYASVEDACEKLCYKVMGQMKRDSRAGTITLDIVNWNGNPAQPIVGNWMGYSIQFNYETSINSFMAFDADDWN